jgi:hypothetical protein
MSSPSEQLERLLSERIDGTLTPEEFDRLERALNQEPQAAALARQYERLQVLLLRWRSSDRSIDWNALAARIGGRVSQAVEGQQLQSVDQALRQWRGRLPEVDWSALQGRVSLAVRREAAKAAVGRRPSGHGWRKAARWLATVGGPLAAAAVIAIVVWRPGAPEQIKPQPLAAAASIVVALEMPRAGGQVAISFDERAVSGEAARESATEGETGDQRASGGAAIALGSSSADPGESIDESLFY